MEIKELSSKLWFHTDTIINYLFPNAEKVSSGWQIGSIQGEKGQSLKITPKKRIWCDFNTGQYGDLIDLWKCVKNVPLSQAINDLADFTNIKIKEERLNFNPDNWFNIINIDSINYLVSRGISKEIVEKFNIKDASIFNHQTSLHEKAMAFPFYKNDKIVQMKYIGINRIDGKKNIRTLENSKPYLFGHQNVNNNLDYIMICEGEIDCLTLHQYGFNVLSVPYGGGKGKKQQWIENEKDFLAKYNKLYLCFDNDDTGNEASDFIARQLYDKQCYKVLLPYKDANECLMQKISSEDMLNYFNQAQLINIRKTTLPISIGSEGFDNQQNYLIKNYIPTNSLCCIYGASGSFKTFLGISWACHIASGKSWNNNAVFQHSVLYIVGEGGSGVSKRIKAWESVHNITLSNLYLVNRPVFILSESDLDEIIVACHDIKNETKMKVGLIIIDTLARCIGDADENTAKDMGGFISGCDKIKNITGSSVLLIHHTGKNEDKGARGSSALKASLDSEFYVSRESKGDSFILTTTKMKDSDIVAPKSYNLTTVNLCSSNDQDAVFSSLVINDISQEPQYSIPIELSDIKNLSENHIKTYLAITDLCGNEKYCEKKDVLSYLKKQNLNIDKFKNWLNKLASENLIKFEDEIITLLK